MIISTALATLSKIIQRKNATHTYNTTSHHDNTDTNYFRF